MATVLLAGALLASTASAEIPVELPPNESIEAWKPALEMARELIPDLIFGPALGPGPSVRIVGGESHWQLDVCKDGGRGAPLEIAIPTNSAARAELLLVAADLLGERVAPTGPPGAEAAPQATVTAGIARLAVGVDLLPGNSHAPNLLLEPLEISWRSLGFAPVFTVAPPWSPAEDLDVTTSSLGAWLGWIGNPGPRLRAGPELAAQLRGYRSEGQLLQRDWSVGAGLTAAAAWPLADRLWIEPRLRLMIDLPPTTLAWHGTHHELPAWTLQLVLGLQPRTRRAEGRSG